MRMYLRAVAAAVPIVFLTPNLASAQLPSGSITWVGTRVMQICVYDSPTATGTPVNTHLQVTVPGGTFFTYDIFNVPNNQCVERRYAPFGPATYGTHTFRAYAFDPQGGGPAQVGSDLPLASEPCSVFASNTAPYAWCNGVPYYQQRQAMAKPLISDRLWAAVDMSLGGAILQMYYDGNGADRSFNLIDEHGGAGVQLDLWGAIPSTPPGDITDSTQCQGFQYAGREYHVNVIQAAAPDCSYFNNIAYGGGYGGYSTYDDTSDNHIRKLTLPGFKVWNTSTLKYFNGYPYLEVTFTYRNDSQYNWTESDEGVAIYPSAPLNYQFFIPTTNQGVLVKTPNGARECWRLNFIAHPGCGNDHHITNWNSDWISTCDNAGHCLTVAPKPAPSSPTLFYLNLMSNFAPTGINYIANQMSWYQRSAITIGFQKEYTFLFLPYHYSAVVPYLSQLRSQ